jgi:hypothetical protein
MRRILAVVIILLSGTTMSLATAFEAGVTPLLEASCLVCHNNDAVTPLNMTKVGHDLADMNTYRTWLRIYDRVDRGEMPPVGIPVDAVVRDAALATLKRALISANMERRQGQRTALRRLTRLEYAYTLQDLLYLDEEVGRALGDSLPAEADSGGFDTVASKQGMSALHVRSYLEAADRALDAALKLGKPPEVQDFKSLYRDSAALSYMFEGTFVGGGIIKKLDDGVAIFFDVGSTYTMHSMNEGFHVQTPGRYEVTAEVWRYQADTPVILTLYRGVKQGVTASLDELIGSFDLVDDERRVVSAMAYMRPGDLIAPSVSELEVPEGPQVNYFAAEHNVKTYTGEGIAIRSLAIRGPLLESWPPESTTRLLDGIEIDDDGRVVLTKTPYDHIVDIVRGFGARAFRRPLSESEVTRIADLARPVLAAKRPFVAALKVPLRAILSDPSFLHHAGEPGELTDYGLASRLSYFLWRSMPDDELLSLAAAGKLRDQGVLAGQVERLLSDERSTRFVRDFAGQAYRLYELKATSPDGGLYPEWNDLLGTAMALESEQFLTEIIKENLGVGQLVEADFTFLNRRLADHYDVPGVEGQWMRRVTLPADSIRGGLLTHASIHKITANGTGTSPVPRGNFVLASLLGQPSPPPPPGIPGLEPDTRGSTTIRDQLSAHRALPVCASCHQKIDPPGFALESFDPIGGYREKYRVSGGTTMFGDYEVSLPYTQGLPVDASGVTPDGDEFDGFRAYQRLLLTRKLDLLARNLASQLIVLSTGAEIGFADREAVAGLIAGMGDDTYPVRDMIHEVVSSDLFRRQ